MLMMVLKRWSAVPSLVACDVVTFLLNGGRCPGDPAAYSPGRPPPRRRLSKSGASSASSTSLLPAIVRYVGDLGRRRPRKFPPPFSPPPPAAASDKGDQEPASGPRPSSPLLTADVSMAIAVPPRDFWRRPRPNSLIDHVLPRGVTDRGVSLPVFFHRTDPWSTFSYLLCWAAGACSDGSMLFQPAAAT